MSEMMHIEFLIGGSSVIPLVGDFELGEVKEVPVQTGKTLIMRAMAKEFVKSPTAHADKLATKPQAKRDKKITAREDEANGRE